MPKRESDSASAKNIVGADASRPVTKSSASGLGGRLRSRRSEAATEPVSEPTPTPEPVADPHVAAPPAPPAPVKRPRKAKAKAAAVTGTDSEEPTPTPTPTPTPAPVAEIAEVAEPRGGRPISAPREAIQGWYAGESLGDLTGFVESAEGFPELIQALRQGRSATVDGAWGSASALITAALVRHAPGPVLVILAHVGDADDFREDCGMFLPTRPELFPAWERLPREIVSGDETLSHRLRILKRWLGPSPPPLVIAPVQALLQPVPTPEVLADSSRTFHVGDVIPTEDLIAWLQKRGLERVEVVEVVGEFSVRGGIVDVFPPDASEPVRLEFFGDELESIRPFDPGTQRSSGALPLLTVTAPPPIDPDHPELMGPLTAYLPANTWIVLLELADLREEGKQYAKRIEDPRGLYGIDETFAKVIRFPTIALSALSSGSLEQTLRIRVESVERFSGELAKVKAELDSASAGEKVLIACHNPGEAERLGDVFYDTAMAREGRLSLTVGRVRAGFRLAEAGILVIGDHELFSRPDVRRPAARRRYETRAIDSFLDLNEGDLVVHLNHGIGVYRGLQMSDRGDDHAEESLVLEFAQGTKLYVTISKVDLVQKYVGGGKIDPPLSKIGNSTWEKRKQRVAEAVLDLAAELIDLQAQRANEPGYAYPAEDSRWTREFEASFPYQETPDQLAAIAGVKSDMKTTKPMDRLICGDVGYGKTEVAMRAAFQAAECGKQVAVLVPTTVLAEQHHRSFSARMAEYPFIVEVINRFRVRSEIKDVLRRTAAGQVDILIGTHRILQKDVVFKDLGLIIIDEEQRFGVEDKEWLKTLRTTVDVLTLSATPIPRTLHMSLLGIRDISNLETPPLDRKAIETHIGRFDEQLVSRAIRREMNRDGQIYFVHNRVHDILEIRDRLQRIVPDARIMVAHGQMAGEQLEKAMLKFVRHEADILLATTIIESGLDIPNANTIFIHEADRYGLADLHQLRGRVGRYKHRAYAYLLIEEAKQVTPNALRRLKAIEEFHELGAGFKIALRDLEIRGAGNILGAEQSGHIEAVGYELYCTLLENAVRGLKSEPGRQQWSCSVELPWRAYLPKSYIPTAKLKVEIYRRLGRLRTLQQLNDLKQELVDRFGALPPPGENLIAMNELRLQAERWSIERIHIEAKEYAVFTYRNEARIRQWAAAHRRDLIRIVDEKSAYVPLDDKNASGNTIAEWIRGWLNVRTN